MSENVRISKKKFLLAVEFEIIHKLYKRDFKSLPSKRNFMLSLIRFRRHFSLKDMYEQKYLNILLI